MKLVNLFLAAVFMFVITCSVAQAAEAVDPAVLFAQIADLVAKWGGMEWVAKISAIILIVVASFQVSFLQPLWDKLGSAKAWLPLVLAIIGGILSLDPITLPGVLAYLGAGGLGALALRQLIEVLKAIPGISKIWISIFDFLAKLLGGQTTEQLQVKKIEMIEAKIAAGKP